MTQQNEEIPSENLYEIDTETVQSLAEANLGRELTKQELKRFCWALVESDDAQHALTEAIITAAEDAMDNSDGRWSSFDEV